MYPIDRDRDIREMEIMLGIRPEFHGGCCGGENYREPEIPQRGAVDKSVCLGYIRFLSNGDFEVLAPDDPRVPLREAAAATRAIKR